MPVVDGGVVLHARIGAGPGGVRYLVPQLAGADRLGDLAVDAADQVPLAVGLDRPQELVGHPHRVVGVLAGRSEEHTSELQSLMRISYAVFCLKKQNKLYTMHYN